MSFAENLSRVKSRYDELQALLSAGDVQGAEFAKLSKEMSDITPLVEKLEELDRLTSDIEGAEAMLDDPDMHTTGFVCSRGSNRGHKHVRAAPLALRSCPRRGQEPLPDNVTPEQAQRLMPVMVARVPAGKPVPVAA